LKEEPAKEEEAPKEESAPVDGDDAKD